MALKKLPIGIENFEKIITQDYYYSDKTGFIVELLQNISEVTLFTRPRRFGKSLNMDMLKTFFEIGCKKELFDGLAISREKELCEEYMGRFPVILISLKGVEGLNYSKALESLKYIIGNEALRFRFLADSEKLSIEDKEKYMALIQLKDGLFTMSETVLETGLKTLCELLCKHYEQSVILLIDEYDVPLDKAFKAGYYDEMVSTIRNLFNNALKTNNYLNFAVMTGCLRVSKESIFTGLNNIKIHSITDVRYDKYFGFTDDEVIKLLEYYGLSGHFDLIKEWYNGYQFGKTSVYCPWDVINYCYELLADDEAQPEDYWANTSGNDLVLSFIKNANRTTRDEIERLIAGEELVKEIRQDLTYNEINKSIENLWSVLFMTGYLTHRGRVEGKKYRLAIPNREIRDLFIYKIKEWFTQKVSDDVPKLDKFCDAFSDGDTESIENLFNDYLRNTISIRDTAVSKSRKENFYHGILLGLLSHKDNWSVHSNYESGDGYSDILVEDYDNEVGVVIELKYAEDNKLDKACEEALKQIDKKNYDEKLISDGMKKIVKIGIACYKKGCKVVIGE